jgi:microcystin-dependent protein
MPIDYSEFLSTFAYGKIADLSDTSVSLLLSAISYINNRSLWFDGLEPVNDTQWNDIDEIISLAYEETMSNLVGLILPHVMATASAFKFIQCDGGTYLRDDYPLLYDAIDASYIVSGTQFRVPDLRDRVLVGTGNAYALDDSGGVDSFALTQAQMPSHLHTYNQYTFGIDIESVGVPDPTGVGQPALPQNTSSVGGGEAHENRQPYRAVHFVILAG